MCTQDHLSIRLRRETHFALLGTAGSMGYLSQAFSDVAGQQLQLSYWLNAVGDDPSEFTVSFNGTPLLDQTEQTDPNTGGVWTQYIFSVIATGSDTLTFGFQDDPGFMALDNVSVSPAPIPAALPLFATGLVALGLLGWRRKRKQVAV